MKLKIHFNDILRNDPETLYCIYVVEGEKIVSEPLNGREYVEHDIQLNGFINPMRVAAIGYQVAQYVAQLVYYRKDGERTIWLIAEPENNIAVAEHREKMILLNTLIL
jgi:hypothetical protein